MSDDSHDEGDEYDDYGLFESKLSFDAIQETIEIYKDLLDLDMDVYIDITTQFQDGTLAHTKYKKGDDHGTIVFGRREIEFLGDKYGSEDASEYLKGVIAHEVWHLRQYEEYSPRKIKRMRKEGSIEMNAHMFEFKQSKLSDDKWDEMTKSLLSFKEKETSYTSQ